MRDKLIAAGRAGQSHGDRLPRTNAVLSSIFGTEISEGRCPVGAGLRESQRSAEIAARSAI